MPGLVTAIVTAVSALLPNIAGTYITVAGVSSVINSVIVAAAFNTVSAALSGGSAREPTQAEAGGIDQSRSLLLNKRSSVASIPVVYGIRRVGGPMVYLGTSGDDNEYLHMVVVLSEGPIEAIDTVYIDGVSSSDSKFSGLVAVEKSLGERDQAASPLLVASVSNWTADHRLRKTAYVHVRLKYDQDVSAGLPTITADVKGRKLYDPRAGLTGFSDNPALVIRDYLTDTFYGKEINEADIDEDSFIVAANYCDQTVVDPDKTRRRYSCNGVIVTDDTLMRNINRLIGSCRGMLIFSSGQYKLLIDKPEPSTFAFTEDNIIGAWQFQRADIRNHFNRYKAKFFNPDRDWQPDIAVVDNENFRAEDNGRLLVSEIELPFTNSGHVAHRISLINLRQSREQISVEMTANASALIAEVGAVCTITHSTPGWDEKKFRILRIELLDTDEVRITAREYDADVYNIDDETVFNPAPNTNLPDAFSVSPPTGLSLDSGTSQLILAGDGTIHSRIKATWTPATGPNIESQVVEYKKSVDSEWKTISVGAGQAEFFISPVDDGVQYDVRVRSINQIGARSAYAVAPSHVVVGKTEPPEDVTGFNAHQNIDVIKIAWNQVADIDLAGYSLRYNQFPNDIWEDGTPLTAVMRGTETTTASMAPGTWSIMVKARDTSDNYSINSTSLRLVIVNTNDIISAIPYKPEWTGARSNLIRHWTGSLVPKSQNLASDDDWETFDIFVISPYPIGTFTPDEIDEGFDSVPRVWGRIEWFIGPGEVGTANPTTMLLDHRLSAGSYGGFEPFIIGNVEGRFFKPQALIDTSIGVPVVTGFTFIIDQEDRSDEGEAVTTVEIGGTAILFNALFHRLPNVQVTTQGAAARIGTATSITTAGFTAHVFDVAGTDVGGTVNWKATGV